MSAPTTATRRSVLKATGAAIAAAAVPATAAAADEEWTSVESPTDSTLHDVERVRGAAADQVSADAYAVGGSGVVLERSGGDGDWRKELDGGPSGNGNDLYGSDMTDDGKRLWFVGASGAIGEYDIRSGVLNDRSAPMDVTNNFNDVAVTGEAGDANVYVGGDSGKMYYSFENGEEGSWDSVTPGSGSNVNAVDCFGAREGHIVDGNKTVFETDDGSTWDKVGLADANENFYGVDSDGFDDVWICGGGGMIHHWDGAEWTPADTGDASLRDIEVEGDEGWTVGGSGAVYRYDGTWTETETPTGQNLNAVVRGGREIAVGAGGTIIEH
ncbi:MAG: hypothetical protein BRD23_02120 [Halobacteriales archaeon SW_9_67_25]|nr:MAG: hypothetical protein BRD23_02120 [Halobacteriales archaeon SW_9_67_25]